MSIPTPAFAILPVSSQATVSSSHKPPSVSTNTQSYPTNRHGTSIAAFQTPSTSTTSQSTTWLSSVAPSQAASSTSSTTPSATTMMQFTTRSPAHSHANHQSFKPDRLATLDLLIVVIYICLLLSTSISVSRCQLAIIGHPHISRSHITRA